MNPARCDMSNPLKTTNTAETGKKNERIKEEERGGASIWLRTELGGLIGGVLFLSWAVSWVRLFSSSSTPKLWIKPTHKSFLFWNIWATFEVRKHFFFLACFYFPSHCSVSHFPPLLAFHAQLQAEVMCAAGCEVVIQYLSLFCVSNQWNSTQKKTHFQKSFNLLSCFLSFKLSACFCRQNTHSIQERKGFFFNTVNIIKVLQSSKMLGM